MNNGYHQPVLVNEILAGLKVHKGGRYIDATVGSGGHAEKILEAGGRVLGIDRDPQALERTRKRLFRAINSKQLVLARGNFDNLAEIAGNNGFVSIEGILFDLGMSSDQLKSGRGFSFSRDEPLDMRMDPDLKVTAADLVNALGRKELYELFTKLAQVDRARAIADAIVSARFHRRITTTRQLKETVEGVISRTGRLHPATKIFMALRMAVNDELGSLERALPQACELLVAGGRLAVISFHQGEDRIVKQFMKSSPKFEALTKKPIEPELSEISLNPRSRSARLRVAEKKL